MKRVDPDKAKTFKATRYVLLHNPENLTDSQAAQLTDIKRFGRGIWRAYQLNYPALGGGSMGGVGGWCVVDAS